MKYKKYISNNVGINDIRYNPLVLKTLFFWVFSAVQVCYDHTKAYSATIQEYL